MNTGMRRVQVVYQGHVQGVGFRYTTRNLAQGMGVAGGVENCDDGSVRLVAEGPEDVLKRFLLQVRVSRLGPHIADERVEWTDAQGLSGFYYR